MTHEIYLDIDGVLNRWQLDHMSMRCGRKITEEDWSTELGWDIVGVCEELTGEPITSAEFWASVSEYSWSSANKSELFTMLIHESAKIVGCENVHVVSTVPPDRSPESYSGKARWCRDFLPEWLQENVRLVTGKKHKLAKPGRLLIDDATHNVVEWEDAGGEAILVPRPWNSHYGLDPKQFVKKSLVLWGKKVCG